MFGTLYVPKGEESLEFGLADLKGQRIDQPPHGTLRAALIEPFVASFNRSSRRKRAAAGRLNTQSAQRTARQAGNNPPHAPPNWPLASDLQSQHYTRHSQPTGGAQMSSVKEQYEAFPYPPERDPADEKRRLITGSPPSHPLEMDQFLWNGKRDWTKPPLRVLVAGGGTGGDGLIQLAQVLTSARRPYRITYVDLSTASRAIAEERAKMRGLQNITFLTGSLLDAPPQLGEFDYIDCCGVLHHLPEPQDGFNALAHALAPPEGGLGFMVYAPYGRSGVYPLQDAFARLFAGGLPPKERLREARKILAKLPKGHPFAQNRMVGDHKRSDAGFYDLLLHSTDRPYRVAEVVSALDQAGLRLAGFTNPPALYDPSDLTGGDMPPLPDDPVARMSLAEELRGTIRMHTGYAVPKARAGTVAEGGRDLSLVPHLKGVGPDPPLAREIAKRGRITVKSDGGEQITVKLDKAIAPVLAGINGRTPPCRSLPHAPGSTRSPWPRCGHPPATPCCATD